jgi:hypothetical protein
MSNLADAIREAIEATNDALYEAEEVTPDLGGPAVCYDLGQALESLESALRAAPEKA